LENIYNAKAQLQAYKTLIKNETAKYINDHNLLLKITGEKLNSFDCSKQLKKGFALVSDNEGNIIKHREQVEIKDMLNIRFEEFMVEAETIDIKEVWNGIRKL